LWFCLRRDFADHPSHRGVRTHAATSPWLTRTVGTIKFKTAMLVALAALAAHGRTFKDRAVARSLPPEGAAAQLVAREWA
jgi:hypothetical protein